MNLYAVFIEKGLSLINSNGILCYINPNSLLMNESYTKLRKMLVDNVDNREFLTAIPDEDPYVTIYALVNSLAELDSVQRVQIAVDGSQTVMLRDAVSLDTLFEENPELIAD